MIDSAATLRPLGVGINLMPHAVRELTELGLGGELEVTGIPTAEMATSTGTATGSGASPAAGTSATAGRSTRFTGASCR